MNTRIASLLLLWVGCGPSAVQEPATPTRTANEAPPSEAPPPPTPPPTPAAPNGFTRFLLVGDEAGCPAQARGDCHSSAELLADHTLRFDAWGDPGAQVREIAVPEDEFATAMQHLTNPALSSTLSQARACPTSAATESMTLQIEGSEHTAQTGHCNTDEIMGARGAMIHLVTVLFPGHSLVSPPF